MRLASLATMIRRDLGRAGGALVTSGFGIAAGTAALIFFLALGLGVRGVLLGDVFPIDRVELEPPKPKDPGVLGLLLGGGEAPGIPPSDLEALARVPGVKRVYPKLRFAFPASGRGGKEIFGYDVGTSELFGDGIEPALVEGEIPKNAFVDPLTHPGPACADDAACSNGQYCERASGEAEGKCSDPIPVLVSRYLVEIFDKSIAPAHNLPAVGETLVGRAQGVTFNFRVGESLLGRAKNGAPRTAKAKIVGVSKRAIDVGVTMPLEVVKRLNKEYAGARSAERFSSAMVELTSGDKTSELLARASDLGLTPKDTRARDVSVLVSGVIGLLALVAGVILLVSASNIAYTFRVLANERRREIALYRALGAKASDVTWWMLGLAAAVGVAGGTAGVVTARVLALIADLLAAKKLPDFPFKPTSFFAFPPWLFLAGLGFASLFALIGALGPARKAAKSSPATDLAGS